MLEINKIHQGDCLELMKNIPDKSVDMILCDLPYGTTECKWDIVIPLNKLWEQYKRIIKNNGAIVLFGTEPFSSLLRLSNLEMFKYDWIWGKSRPTGFLEAKNKPMRKHEIISIFSFGGSSNGCKNRIIYNPQELVDIKPKIQKNSTDTDILGSRKSRENGSTYIQKQTNYPTTLLEFASESKTIHPTQKPVTLFEYLIKTYSDKRDLILDNAVGSGTTAIASINTGRNWIGIESDEKYFVIAKKRIQEHSQQSTLLPLAENSKEDGIPPNNKLLGILPKRL